MLAANSGPRPSRGSWSLTRSDERVALLSVHPLYAAALVDGRKTVEFRKRRLAPDVSRVRVYATAPLQHVIGEFEVAETVEGTPGEIWDRFGSAGLKHGRGFYQTPAPTCAADDMSEND